MEITEFVEKIMNNKSFAQTVFKIFEKEIKNVEGGRKVLKVVGNSKSSIEVLTEEYAVVSYISQKDNKKRWMACFKDGDEWIFNNTILDSFEEAILYIFASKKEGFSSQGGRYLTAFLNGLGR